MKTGGVSTDPVDHQLPCHFLERVVNLKIHHTAQGTCFSVGAMNTRLATTERFKGYASDHEIDRVFTSWESGRA